MIYSYCRVKNYLNKTTVLAGHRKERLTMASEERRTKSTEAQQRKRGNERMTEQKYYDALTQTEAISWEQQPKTVTLTNELCSTLQCYILMTTKHREGELKAWEEMAQETDENGAPKFKNAASNAQFWRDMEPQLQQILEALD